jgi:hypothetical protein
MGRVRLPCEILMVFVLTGLSILVTQ